MTARAVGGRTTREGFSVRNTWIVAGVLGAAAVIASVLFDAPRVSAEDPPKPQFVGPDNCKTCHLKHHKTWKVTAMAKTFESLKPGAVAEKKKAAGLDPAKDFTRDAKCLKCHTTGYGTSSGYPEVVEGKEWTPQETDRAKRLQGVTCEACHGPGSLYGPFKRDHEAFKLEEVQKLGSTSPPKAEQCMTCHVRECPVMPADYAFDFEKARKSGKDFHDHVPLKHPH
jgi:hypothetical protein